MSKQSKHLKELAEKIYKIPGEPPRWVFAVEEMSELTKELMKKQRYPEKGRFDDIDDIVEEACDSILTIWMMLDNWGVSKKDIYDHMIEKCKRTICDAHFKPYPACPSWYPVTVGPVDCNLAISMISDDAAGKLVSNKSTGQSESANPEDLS